MDLTIKTGDLVRSFDFPEHDKSTEGKNACFIEGEIVDIGRLLPEQGCNVYKIKVTRKIFGGEEISEHEEFYYPPVNGTPTWLGDKTHGVEKI